MRIEQTKWGQRRETLWPVLLAVTVSWCSGNPAVDIGGWDYSPDKIAHFAVYGALATAILRNKSLNRWPRLAGWTALLVASGYGLGDEYRQRLSHVRQFDWFDWVADTTGAVVAVSLYRYWPRYRALLEMPVRFRRAKAASCRLVTDEPTATTPGPQEIVCPPNAPVDTKETP